MADEYQTLIMRPESLGLANKPNATQEEVMSVVFSELERIIREHASFEAFIPEIGTPEFAEASRESCRRMKEQGIEAEVIDAEKGVLKVWGKIHVTFHYTEKDSKAFDPVPIVLQRCGG